MLSRHRPICFGILPTLLLIVCLPAGTSAHPLTATETTIRLGTDGTFQADLIVDLDALALGAPQDTDDAELVTALNALSQDEFDTRLAQLKRLFQRRVRLRFDGTPAPFEVSFPDHGTPASTEATIPTVLGLTARLIGTIPEDTTEFEFFASRAFAEVNLTIYDETTGETRQSLIERGARSDPFPLGLPVPPPDTITLLQRYLYLGFVHIVPRGLDHVLFVLGLFLLGSKLLPLVWQITAFTVAHAVTLSLAVFGVVSLPPSVVEPLIALSIAYVAVENLLTDRLTLWRPTVVFVFGLLHGLGFADVLQNIGLPAGEQLLGLVSFNLGIELGQLVVIALAMVAIGWCRSQPWYRHRVSLPCSGLIAAIGIYWAASRAGAAW